MAISPEANPAGSIPADIPSHRREDGPVATLEPPNPDAAAARPNQRSLADYALIGDMRGTALLSNDAAMEWLC